MTNWRDRALGRRLLASGGVAGMLALTLGASASYASVSTNQVFTVPAGGTFTIEGHGFGHGHGMSQYGAQGAALDGLTYQQILSFYYPGTTLASTSTSIAVLITADTTPDLQVVNQPGLQVRDRGSGKVYVLPAIAGVSKWRINVVRGQEVIGYWTRSWHRYHLPGGLAHLVGDGEVSSPGKTLTLITPTGRETVRGVLRAASPSPGSMTRQTVNVLPLDQYVQGVVPREMPTSWAPAAVRAQAVAARTYALFERAANLNRYYQICDTAACQVYGGVSAETSGGNVAVAATAGRYLAYGGKPAFAQFASSNGGYTSYGGQPYLPHKPDPYDGWSGNPVHSWSVQVKAAAIQSWYPSLGKLQKITVTRREGGGAWQGWVQSLTLTGAKGSRTISGDDLRTIYALRSDWFAFAAPKTATKTATKTAAKTPAKTPAKTSTAARAR